VSITISLKLRQNYVNPLTGRARFVVGDMRTGANVRNDAEQTQMTSSAVNFGAWIAADLLVFGHGSELHESFQSFTEDAALLAGGFIHAFDGFTPPVRPVGSTRTMSGPLDQLDAESAT
jgi:hypothetical protein